jgi:hypothetical protein
MTHFSFIYKNICFIYKCQDEERDHDGVFEAKKKRPERSGSNLNYTLCIEWSEKGF